MQTPPLHLSDYKYDLPTEKIALHPLPEREQARLLVYRHGEIEHSHFSSLSDYLPEDSLLVFNDTRVVQARLHFRRSTGAVVEVFCLRPLFPYKEMSLAMQQQQYAVWECMAGNQKRWKEGEILTLSLPDGELTARLVLKKGREVEVEFQWQPETMSWAEVLEKAGKIPLPPYIQREAAEQDRHEYQTVFARQEGAVAAPTAGLHFTEALIQQLENKGIESEWLTLHVSAGTFQPVEVEDILAHPMHNEQLTFLRAFIEKLAHNGRRTICVGTTSLRALESLYWFGHQLLKHPDTDAFFVPKLYPYAHPSEGLPTIRPALQAVLHWMEKRRLDELWGQTEIFIMPGYSFRMAKGLITNFHLPQSTLLMLVSAFIGDEWKKVYASALENDYRFLSYGDGSLLLP